MKFSWKALVLAPLAVPFLCTALLTISSPGKNPVGGFLLLFALGCVVSYAVTIFLFLPCLFIVSRFTTLTAPLTGLIGTVLGALVYFPEIWQSWRESGVDSGPPTTTFAEFFRQRAFGSDFWALLAAGLLTAMLYWRLADRPLKQERDHLTTDN